MSLCCIGGVCVPYTAIVPVLLLALKWLASQLAALGLLPESVVKRLGLAAAAGGDCCVSGECKSGTQQKCGAAKSSGDQLKVVQSEEEFENLVATGEAVIIQFTAGWCKPCKAIAPYFEELAGKYKAHFVQVDVDEFDEISSKYKVAMMPTFVLIEGDKTITSMTGSNTAELEEFCKANLTA